VQYDGMGWFEVNAGVLMQQFMSLAGNGICDDVYVGACVEFWR